mmetsp:Transcript_65338/g.120403  ORF Transcript_65338/g.120403 Transcript_65338/m.120403 type:complete len:96 (+) Transcript_65338:412-699(+)
MARFLREAARTAVASAGAEDFLAEALREFAAERPMHSCTVPLASQGDAVEAANALPAETVDAAERDRFILTVVDILLVVDLFASEDDRLSFVTGM